jgi:TRAP-type uncharacterized transport system substrate-binding protein
MKRFINSFLIALAVFTLFVDLAHSEDLVIATGKKGGTYYTVINQLANRCDKVSIANTETAGSVENLGMIQANQANAGAVQVDVLSFASKNDDLSAIKTLIPLHNEKVHFLARTNSGLKVGGVLGIGSDQVVLSSIKQLGGLTVGAAGGSYITAQVIRLQSEIAYVVKKFDDDEEAVAALGRGEVQAVVMVTGEPSKPIQALSKDYKLLSIESPELEKVAKAYYRPTRLSLYKNLSVSSANTVSVRSVLVTRDYRSAKMIASLKSLRDCAAANLDDLKETAGMHAAWQTVNLDDYSAWPKYDIPTGKK